MEENKFILKRPMKLREQLQDINKWTTQKQDIPYKTQNLLISFFYGAQF